MAGSMFCVVMSLKPSNMYSIAQFKLDILMHVALEFLNKFAGLLASFVQVHDPIF